MGYVYTPGVDGEVTAPHDVSWTSNLALRLISFSAMVTENESCCEWGELAGECRGELAGELALAGECRDELAGGCRGELAE